MSHEGSCHCGAVRIAIMDDPVDAGTCNCSLCRRTGALWTYASPKRVKVTGEGQGYTQGDMSLTLWRCPVCGIATHWTATDPAYDRMGVNLRIFDPLLWDALPRRFIDGASW